MKTVRGVGAQAVGTAYSIYYASNGLMGAFGSYCVLQVYKAVAANDAAARDDAFFWSVLTVALLTAIVPFILLYLLRDYRESAEAGEKNELPTLKDSIAVIRTPSIWFIAAILFCTYSLYVGLTFFTPYLTYAFHVSDETSGTLTIIRSFVFMSLTPLTGLFADKVAKSTLKWFMIACPLVALSLAGVLYLGSAEGMRVPVIILTMVAAFFVCSLYASMFSIVSECRIPMSIAGTAIGLVSIFSYTPDIVMQPLFGHFVDVNKYGSIFLTLVVMALISFSVAAFLFWRNKKLGTV